MSADNSAARESANLGDAGYQAPANTNLTDEIKSGLSSVTNAASSFFHHTTGGSNYTSNQPSHTDAKADSILGNVKETFGSATGNSGLQGSGQGQRAAGSAQDEAATLTGYVKDQVNSASSYIGNVANTLSGGSGNYVSDEANRLDAGIDKTVGDVRSRVGGLFGATGTQGAGDAQHARGEAQEVAAGVRENLASVADQMQGRDPALPKPDPWRAE